MASGSNFNLGEAYILNSQTGTTVADTYSTPAALINTLLPNVFMIAGVILFFYVIGAGFKMVMSPDNKKNAEEGKKAITFALSGFLIMIGAYWLVQIIEIVTGITIFGGL